MEEAGELLGPVERPDGGEVAAGKGQTVVNVIRKKTVTIAALRIRFSISSSRNTISRMVSSLLIFPRLP